MYSTISWIFARFAFVSAMMRSDSSRRVSYTLVPATSFRRESRSASRMSTRLFTLPCCTM